MCNTTKQVFFLKVQQNRQNLQSGQPVTVLRFEPAPSTMIISNQFITHNTLHNKQLPNLYSSQSIFRVMDSRRIRPARKAPRGGGGGQRERGGLVSIVLNLCIKYENSWPHKRLSVQNPLRSSQIVGHSWHP